VSDEADFPGGIVQHFRVLRPLAEAVLEGYAPTFLGMLESPADGMGCWKAAGGSITLVGPVFNATFATFAMLCDGGRMHAMQGNQIVGVTCGGLAATESRALSGYPLFFKLRVRPRYTGCIQRSEQTAGCKVGPASGVQEVEHNANAEV
jgi:hypothetical protein